MSNKNKNKKKTEQKKEEQIEMTESVKDAPADKVRLYDEPDEGTDPIATAASLIGVSVDKLQLFEKVSKSEFLFTGYGLSIRFIKDKERWRMSVNQNMTRSKCNQAAYWLLDKLAADTDEKVFYTPGREGIRR